MKTEGLFPPTVGVFIRNYTHYLEEAVRKSEIVFRSSKRWIGVYDQLVKRDQVCVVYYATVGGGQVIEYKSSLEKVLLDPKAGTLETEEWLALTPQRTQENKEELWEDGMPVRTLYRISECVKIEPFPMSDLIKMNGGTPLSADYDRGSPVLVYPQTFPFAKAA